MYMHTHTHTLSQIEVVLVKDPTLGLGITGGKDGENAIKAGDKVSSVCGCIQEVGV